jgi:hypothetical protein
VSREVPWLPCRSTEWVRRLGACCRCVSLHHGWGLWPAAYKDVARCFVHLPAAPLEHRHPRHAQVCRRARSRTRTSPCGVALRTILDRFCARRPSRLRSGRGKACGAVELEKWPWRERARTIRRARTHGGCPARKKKHGHRKLIGPVGHPLDKNRPIQGTSHERPGERLHLTHGRGRTRRFRGNSAGRGMGAVLSRPANNRRVVEECG